MNPATFCAVKEGKNRNANLYIAPAAPISNIFYLLQVLAPGMLVIYYEDAGWKVSRLLPEASWIESNLTSMSKMDALIAAAEDRNIAFKIDEKRTARHHSSLPRRNALPRIASNRKTVIVKEGTSSKDQKTSSQKKNLKRQQLQL